MGRDALSEADCRWILGWLYRSLFWTTSQSLFWLWCLNGSVVGLCRWSTRTQRIRIVKWMASQFCLDTNCSMLDSVRSELTAMQWWNGLSMCIAGSNSSRMGNECIPGHSFYKCSTIVDCICHHADGFWHSRRWSIGYALAKFTCLMTWDYWAEDF